MKNKEINYNRISTWLSVAILILVAALFFTPARAESTLTFGVEGTTISNDLKAESVIVAGAVDYGYLWTDNFTLSLRAAADTKTATALAGILYTPSLTETEDFIIGVRAGKEFSFTDNYPSPYVGLLTVGARTITDTQVGTIEFGVRATTEVFDAYTFAPFVTLSVGFTF